MSIQLDHQLSWEDRKLRILVVDDDVVSRTVLEEHLSAAGHEVLLCASVAQAIAALEHQRVQIIIADWLMPEATGIQLCQWLRRQPCGMSLHFVMLTVLSDKARLIEAFEAGVDDFLSKPLHEGELLARLRAWTRIVSLQAQLAEQATLDDLTTLPNRRQALRRVSEQWAIAARYGQPLSCAIIDVDNFKQINDTAGHRAGDGVLQHLAQRLAASLREADGVFRIGGDEFLVLLPNTSAAAAITWATRCRDAIAATPAPVAGNAIPMTISIGVAQREATMQQWEEMIEAADADLLAVKRQIHQADRACRFASNKLIA